MRRVGLIGRTGAPEGCSGPLTDGVARTPQSAKMRHFCLVPRTVTHPQGLHPVIEFQRVQKTYRVAGRDVPALQATDLRVAAGEVFGLIGHSGAGKSTLLRLINRLENPTGGRIIVDGEDITALDADDDAAAGGVLQAVDQARSEEHTSELQSRPHLVCRLLLEK